jgi:hypothetical protein
LGTDTILSRPAGARDQGVRKTGGTPPSLTAQKLRRLELTGGAPVRKGKPSGVWVTHAKMRQAEKQLAAQAQASYERAVRDRQAGRPKKAGASVTAERA